MSNQNTNNQGSNTPKPVRTQDSPMAVTKNVNTIKTPPPTPSSTKSKN